MPQQRFSGKTAVITGGCSGIASYITGVILPVDGGITAGKREDMDRVI